MLDYEVLNVKTDDFSMDYLKFGKGRKILVILPGLSLRSVLATAKAVVKAYSVFAEDFTVYLFDRVKDVPKGYTVYGMAKDTYSAIKTLSLKDIYLYGVSQGGMISEVIAIEHPDLVKKLALCSTLAGKSDHAISVIDEWKKLAKSHDQVSLNERIFEMIFSPETLKKNKILFSLLKQEGNAADCERFYALADAMTGFDVSGRIDAIRCKTLVLGAENDKVIPSSCMKFIADKLGCESYFYDDFGHAVYDEAPNIKERLFSFFEKD